MLLCVYLQTNLTGECYSEDIVSFAKVIIPRIVLVHRVLGSDGNTEDHYGMTPSELLRAKYLEKLMTIMMNLSKAGAQTNQWINFRTLK